MKIMLLNSETGKAGTYGGTINLGLKVSNLKLRYGDQRYIISLRDEVHWSNLPDSSDGKSRRALAGSYDLGAAKGRVLIEAVDGGGFKYTIAIESESLTDFLKMRTHIYGELGLTHHQLD